MTTEQVISLYEDNAGGLYMVSSDCDEAVCSMEFSEASFAEDAAEWSNWHNDASNHCPSSEVTDAAEKAHQEGNDGMVLIAEYTNGNIERFNQGGTAAGKYMRDED